MGSIGRGPDCGRLPQELTTVGAHGGRPITISKRNLNGLSACRWLRAPATTKQPRRWKGAVGVMAAKVATYLDSAFSLLKPTSLETARERMHWHMAAHQSLTKEPDCVLSCRG